MALRRPGVRLVSIVFEPKQGKQMMKTKLILASNSPRRKELLGGLGIPFEVRVLQGIDETYPDTIPTNKLAEFSATNKEKVYEVSAD